MHSPTVEHPTIGLISPPALAARFSLNFPTNLTVLGGAVKEAGFRARIVDLNLEAARGAARFFEDPMKCSMRIIEQNASDVDCFGLTTLCSTYPFTLQLAAKLKQIYGKPIILGGPQATMTAARTLELFPAVDFVVAHEGEVTLVELMRAIHEGGDLRKVAGIYYRDQNSIRSTAFRPFIENLDDSPFPDFAAIDIRAYQEIYPGVRIPVDTGRGCPFQCTFCSTAMMWKRSFRMKSPKRAVAEMDTLHQQFGINWFFLTQDNLTTSSRYIGELCQELQGRNYTWDCYSRCDTLSDDTLRAMVAAGCRHIFFGIESGSERFQKTIRKNLKFDRVQKSIRACIDQGASFSTAYIIGFPDEDRQDLSDTLRSCFRDAARNPRYIIFSVLSPLPGTELVDKYRDRLTAPLAFQPDFSPLLMKNELAEDARRMILAHSDLFSSFYFIQPFHFDLNELFEIRNFYYPLIHEFPRSVHLILQYTSIEPLQLIELYREMGFTVQPEAMTAEVFSRFFTELLDRYHGDSQGKSLLIREVLKYELAIRQVRMAVTPEFLKQSQSRAPQMRGQRAQAGALSFSPSLVWRSFQVDINRVLKAFPREDHRVEPLDRPLELLFYEDAVQGDVLVEEIDPGKKARLEGLRASAFAEVEHFDADLVDMMSRGLVVYHQGLSA